MIDSKYKIREKINIIDDYFVLGSHAKYSHICSGPDPMKCEFHNEETIIDNDHIRKAWSESEMMRFNYHGY